MQLKLSVIHFSVRTIFISTLSLNPIGCSSVPSSSFLSLHFFRAHLFFSIRKSQPHIKYTTQKIPVQAIQYNEQLNLHCPVNGVPKPEKLWYKKRYNETIELPFTENVRIKNFQSHDEGIYVCEAKNQIGVSQEIKYHVTGRADGESSFYYVHYVGCIDLIVCWWEVCFLCYVRKEWTFVYFVDREKMVIVS